MNYELCTNLKAENCRNNALRKVVESGNLRFSLLFTAKNLWF